VKGKRLKVKGERLRDERLRSGAVEKLSGWERLKAESLKGKG
jgi:hypothetical protein